MGTPSSFVPDQADETAPLVPKSFVPDEDGGGGGSLKAAAANALNLIGGHSMAQSQELMHPGAGAQFDAAVAAGRKDHPLASAAGTLGMGAAAFGGLPGSSAVVGGVAPMLAGVKPEPPPKGAGVLEQISRGIAAPGAGLPTGLAAAGLSALGQRFPTTTGLGLAGAGAFTKNAADQAELLAAGLGLAGAGAAKNVLGAVGRGAAKAGESARQTILEALTKEALPAATKEARASNSAGAKAFKDRFRLLQGTTEPVRGAGVPGAPPAEEISKQAAGKLGSEIQDNFRFLRSKDDLGLNLSPEAQAGVEHILPDYEAQANQSLERMAKGKGERLKEILAALSQNQSAAGPKPGPASGPNAAAGFFPNPELLPTSGTLKPNPLAGFSPAPVPTAESLGTKLAPQVQPRLDAMRAEQGLGSRLLGGTAKAMMNPVLAGAAGGGLYTGSPKVMAGAGLVGAGRAMVNDPVLATAILEPAGRVLQGGGALAQRASRFIAGATGATLIKKLEFLTKNDPEFAQAIREAGAQ